MPKDSVCGMEVKKNNSLKLCRGGKIHYFCSENCLKKFARQHGIDKEEVNTCMVKPGTKLYKNKIVIISLILGLLFGLSYIIPVLEPFRKSLAMYFGRIWWAILLGLIFGGVIDYFVPREYVSGILAKRRKRTIFYSVILGFFMSACSHGILALSIELHKKGASNPAVIAFLLASPWANFPITIMLIGFFGVFKALYIIVGAVLIAIITGFVYQILELKGVIEINNNIKELDKNFSIVKDIKSRLTSSKFTFNRAVKGIKGILSGAVSLANMVLWWILLGMGLASLSGAYIPQDIFQNYMGPTFLGLIVTLIVAIILEVCSEGTAPLAFEIFKQTGALGNAFVFLMAGVVTDYTEIGLLWHNVGRKVAIFLPIVTVPQVIGLAILANFMW